MIRAHFRMLIVLLLIPTTRAWGADEIPLPVRLATSEEEIPPAGASEIGVTTQIFVINLTKLEKETGIKLETGTFGEISADQVQATVAALRKSSPQSSGAGTTLAAPGTQDLLDALLQNNIAKVWTSAGEITATGPPNRLVVGGLELVESDHAERRSQLSNQMRFYAMARANNRIALDLRLRLAVDNERRGPDGKWRPQYSFGKHEWGVATVQRAGEPTIWLGGIEERTETVQTRTWVGGRTIEERVTHTAPLLVVTAEMKEPRQVR